MAARPKLAPLSVLILLFVFGAIFFVPTDGTDDEEMATIFRRMNRNRNAANMRQQGLRTEISTNMLMGELMNLHLRDLQSALIRRKHAQQLLQAQQQNLQQQQQQQQEQQAQQRGLQRDFDEYSYTYDTPRRKGGRGRNRRMREGRRAQQEQQMRQGREQRRRN